MRVLLQVQRSVSQGDMNDTNGRRVRSTAVACSATNNGTKLKRCASLPAQKQRSVPYMSSKETENLKLQLESSVESLGKFYTLTQINCLSVCLSVCLSSYRSLFAMSIHDCMYVEWALAYAPRSTNIHRKISWMCFCFLCLTHSLLY